MSNHIDDRPLEAPIGEDGEPVLQVDRLDAVVKHALTSDNWDQTAWMRRKVEGKTSCGTTYCIAGFAAVEFAGLEPVQYLINEPWIDTVNVDGSEKSIGVAAMQYLGLNPAERDNLFHSKNTADDVERIVEKIKEGYYRG